MWLMFVLVVAVRGMIDLESSSTGINASTYSYLYNITTRNGEVPNYETPHQLNFNAAAMNRSWKTFINPLGQLAMARLDDFGPRRPHASSVMGFQFKIQFSAERDTSFHLCTSNRTTKAVFRPHTEEILLYNADSLRRSRFNPFNPTRILIHGWLGNSRAGIFRSLVPEYLKLDTNNSAKGHFNVFIVDWGRGAIADYVTASNRVKSVGKVLAKFIDFVHHETGIPFEKIHLIGFSMGAHIAGIAGKYIQSGRIPVIFGLDPAMPYFNYDNIDSRLSLTDATYVEVIHSNIAWYGYDRPLGHTDFYVNYGSHQPGCFFLNECDHFRAYLVFAESIRQSRNKFWAQGCDANFYTELIENERCFHPTGKNLTMGGAGTPDFSRRGVYYLPTNAKSPYARGRNW